MSSCEEVTKVLVNSIDPKFDDVYGGSESFFLINFEKSQGRDIQIE
jgi:hypothetical protein